MSFGGIAGDSTGTNWKGCELFVEVFTLRLRHCPKLTIRQASNGCESRAYASGLATWGERRHSVSPCATRGNMSFFP